jgi:hypothetical protein
MLKMKQLTAVCAIAVSIAASGIASAAAGDGVSVFATGFNSPRGVTFGPDNNLYVAEAGLGGTRSTIGQCTPVPGAPGGPGPYTGGSTARISKVAPNGKRTTVIDGLPSAQGQPLGPLGPPITGVDDIAFIGNELYALIAGGGCSHGNPNSPAGVYLVDRQHGKAQLVANLSAFFAAHPAAHPDPEDFEPDGTLFSLVAVHRKLYAIEPNQGRLLEIDPENGDIRQLLDLSALPWVGPTAMAYDGVFHVGTLSPLPTVPGAANIFDITKRGKIIDTDTGFTTITGLAVSPQHGLYVLEMATNPGLYAPQTGKLVLAKDDGDIQEILTGLTFPVGNMAFGSDGALYLSNFSTFSPGQGQILRVEVSSHED